MVQKEAGQRLCTPVGTRDMGAVTVAVNYFSKAKILFNVSRGSFMPAPNVDSCVIQFELKEDTPKTKDEKYFFTYYFLHEETYFGVIIGSYQALPSR